MILSHYENLGYPTGRFLLLVLQTTGGGIQLGIRAERVQEDSSLIGVGTLHVIMIVAQQKYPKGTSKKTMIA